MARKADVPQFGPLAGVKVVHSSLSVAGPFAAEMFAEYGADVIWIENPMGPDISRGGTATTIKQDRRNQRNIALSIPTPEGREVFLKLIKDADIFIEASKGGQYEKWGLNDEVMWEVNPKLVIVHISGFGQTGLPEYVSRASYDPIAQAASGYMKLNGYPDRPPIPAFPVAADYFTALFATTAALSAMHRANLTGQGESIDVAQYEVMLRVSSLNPMEYLLYGKEPKPEGNHSQYCAGYGSFPCKDGNEIYTLFLGPGVLKNALPLIGLEYGSEMFPKGSPMAWMGTPAADLLEEKLKEFCANHTALEVSDIFNKHSVPCSAIYDYEMAANDPHYQAREAFTEWEDIDGKTVKGVNIAPKFKNSETKIWRGGPNMGQDSVDILKDLGYGDEDIQKLAEAKSVFLGKQ
ncbi:L-carnitine CoA-transferase [Desulfitobacterium sp. THU1]|uniref:L-carnitine CoA-transferase n=1 Tax=Desulfitobacterium sp. THU1 TaxID=3138072 RepID=UPI00311F0716